MKWSAKHKLYTAPGKLNSRPPQLPTSLVRGGSRDGTGIIDHAASWLRLFASRASLRSAAARARVPPVRRPST